jgi:hypothetical protein
MTGAVTNDISAITVIQCNRADLKKYENMTVGEVPKAEKKHPVDGGKKVLLGISKRGDQYLRTLFIHGGTHGSAHRGKTKGFTWRFDQSAQGTAR